MDDRDTTSSLSKWLRTGQYCPECVWFADDRFIEVMNTLRYGAARAPILVGHSLFFKLVDARAQVACFYRVCGRDFFKRFTGPAFERANKRLAADLQATSSTLPHVPAYNRCVESQDIECWLRGCGPRIQSQSDGWPGEHAV